MADAQIEKVIAETYEDLVKDCAYEPCLRELAQRVIEIAADKIECEYADSMFAEHSFIVRDLRGLASDGAAKGEEWLKREGFLRLAKSWSRRLPLNIAA